MTDDDRRRGQEMAAQVEGPGAASVRDPRFAAAVELVGRTGATSFAIRYCDESEPVIWMALARHGPHWSVGAALDPLRAVFDLCDSLVDGGTCRHCGRPTGFVEDFDDQLDEALGRPLVCWLKWDPELETYRRSCEGSTP